MGLTKLCNRNVPSKTFVRISISINGFLYFCPSASFMSHWKDKIWIGTDKDISLSCHRHFVVNQNLKYLLHPVLIVWGGPFVLFEYNDNSCKVKRIGIVHNLWCRNTKCLAEIGQDRFETVKYISKLGQLQLYIVKRMQRLATEHMQ